MLGALLCLTKQGKVGMNMSLQEKHILDGGSKRSTAESRILIMAGGTGGHVFPALAVAEQLRAAGVEVVWMGTQRGLEADVIPRAGIPIDWIRITGLRGKGPLGWALAPLRLANAVAQAVRVMRHRRPAAVLGMGGFVTGPGGFTAWLLRKPLLIHEQNAIPGMTNRILARFATTVMEAFPGAIHGRSDVIDTGNPIRDDLTRLPPPEQRLQGRQGPLHLLVVGGSLGAAALNEVVPQALAALPEEQRPEVWHQAGKRNIDATLELYRQAGVQGRVAPFIDDMAEAYAWADLVLCRAGALTVSELAAVGVGAVLVPYPYAVDDHQTSNARYLSDAGAAVLVPQPQLTVERLRDLLAGLDRAQLIAMAGAARALARPDAARRVAQLCMEAARV